MIKTRLKEKTVLSYKKSNISRAHHKHQDSIHYYTFSASTHIIKQPLLKEVILKIFMVYQLIINSCLFL